MKLIETCEMMPQEVSDAEFAFPARVSHLMPPMEDIPEEIEHHWAMRFVRDWFFVGVTPHEPIPWHDDIDYEMALRHLGAIQGSFEPKHEHKEAAVAWLVASWTKREFTWDRGQG